MQWEMLDNLKRDDPAEALIGAGFESLDQLPLFGSEAAVLCEFDSSFVEIHPKAGHRVFLQKLEKLATAAAQIKHRAILGFSKVVAILCLDLADMFGRPAVAGFKRRIIEIERGWRSTLVRHRFAEVIEVLLDAAQFILDRAVFIRSGFEGLNQHEIEACLSVERWS